MVSVTPPESEVSMKPARTQLGYPGGDLIRLPIVDRGLPVLTLVLGLRVEDGVGEGGNVLI